MSSDEGASFKFYFLCVLFSDLIDLKGYFNRCSSNTLIMHVQNRQNNSIQILLRNNMTAVLLVTVSHMLCQLRFRWPRSVLISTNVKTDFESLYYTRSTHFDTALVFPKCRSVITSCYTEALDMEVTLLLYYSIDGL